MVVAFSDLSMRHTSSRCEKNIYNQLLYAEREIISFVCYLYRLWSTVKKSIKSRVDVGTDRFHKTHTNPSLYGPNFASRPDPHPAIPSCNIWDSNDTIQSTDWCNPKRRWKHFVIGKGPEWWLFKVWLSTLLGYNRAIIYKHIDQV